MIELSSDSDPEIRIIEEDSVVYVDAEDKVQQGRKFQDDLTEKFSTIFEKELSNEAKRALLKELIQSLEKNLDAWPHKVNDTVEAVQQVCDPMLKDCIKAFSKIQFEPDLVTDASKERSTKLKTFIRMILVYLVCYKSFAEQFNDEESAGNAEKVETKQIEKFAAHGYASTALLFWAGFPAWISKSNQPNSINLTSLATHVLTMKKMGEDVEMNLSDMLFSNHGVINGRKIQCSSSAETLWYLGIDADEFCQRLNENLPTIQTEMATGFELIPEKYHFCFLSLLILDDRELSELWKISQYLSEDSLEQPVCEPGQSRYVNLTRVFKFCTTDFLMVLKKYKLEKNKSPKKRKQSHCVFLDNTTISNFCRKQEQNERGTKRKIQNGERPPPCDPPLVIRMRLESEDNQ